MTKKQKEPKHITISLILGYIAGIISLLFGLTGLIKSFFGGLLLIIGGLIILPLSMRFIEKKLNIRLSKWLKVIAFIILFIMGMALIGRNIESQEKIDSTAKDVSDSTTVENKELPEMKIVSKSYNDIGILCEKEGATDLQKQNLFETKFKNQYIEWTGEINRIDKQAGQYIMKVKHCATTITYDVEVNMNENQFDKLLQLHEKDTVTYKAKLTRLGAFDYLYATDGEIIE